MESVQTTSAGLPHIPVMLGEVLENLAPRAGETYVDGTFGAGGYSRAILDHAGCNVIAIDRDPEVHHRAGEWIGTYKNRLSLVHDCFGNVEKIIRDPVDGFVLDLGVSSMQLDQGARGFSFRHDGPLDMRMNPQSGESAADIVATRSERDLADIIYLYGEERHSRRIARAIVEMRQQEPITTTGQLATLVRSVLPRPKRDESDPATRTFQALRIAVNDELGELERALDGAEHILKPGGRLVVVTFHSLEDRIVKNFMKVRSGDIPSPSRHMPSIDMTDYEATFQLDRRKAIEADPEETKKNPRARSAKLRVAIRTDAPAVQGGKGVEATR